MKLSQLTNGQLERLYRVVYYRMIRAQPGRDWSTLYYYSPKWYRTLKAILEEGNRRQIRLTD